MSNLGLSRAVNGIAAKKHIYQRVGIVAFLAVFLFTVIAPSAYAITVSPKDPVPASDTHVTPLGQATTTGEHTLSSPQGLQPTTSATNAAADAGMTATPSNTFVDQLNKPAQNQGEALGNVVVPTAITPHELTGKRTAHSSLEINKDGSITEKDYLESHFYKKDGQWTTIDNTLTEDKNAADSSNIFGKALGQVESWFSSTTNFTTTNNSWQAHFSPSDAPNGMVRVEDGGQIGYVPVNAKQVAPVVTTNDNGQQVVHYYDLWPGVNVEYVVTSDAVKENIVLKDRDAAKHVAFNVVGADLEQQKDGSFAIKNALDDNFSIAAPTLMLNNHGPVTDDVLHQSYAGNQLSVSIDDAYVQSLPDDAFPAVIDPSTFYSNFGTRAGGNYVSFKSDGYVCQSSTCNPYAGSLYDTNNTLRYWRSAVYANYDQFKDSSKVLTNATLHLQQRTDAGFWTGTYDTHTFYVGHASCTNSFNCLEGNTYNASGSLATSGNINVTNIYQAMISRGDFGAWLMLGSEDGTTSSFKNFDPGTGGTSGSYVSFTYGGQPAAPSVSAPVANQVYVDPQPSFSVNTMANPNGSTPLQYEMLVSSAPGAAGTLITSGKQNSTQWTVPDGILQDGFTYYVQARSYDPITSSYSSWGASVPFKIDMRTGSDKTQTYDSMGPVSVDLATGNVATSAASHASTALGGSLGVTMDYNSPLRSRNGLVGKYWNNTTYAGSPVVTRVDQNVDFNWDAGSPSSGTVPNDSFAARWEGYFVAPETGSYQFGSDADDGCRLWVNNQSIVDSWTTCTSQYGTSMSLTAGQIVPVKMDYREDAGTASVHLRVKGVVGTGGMIVPADWLQTGVRPIADQHGLTGNYFARNDGTNTFSAANTQFMKRVDPYLSFSWGTSPPVAGGPSDFLVRWSGYITAPTSGAYTFGSRSDDGSKIIVGSNNTVALNDWTDHSPPASPTWGGTTVNLTANVPTKVTIEYYDTGGGATYEFWIKSSTVAQQIVPTSWLSPNAQVLPDGWALGQSNGSANYDHLTANQNSVTLTDTGGQTHEYTWTGSGYTPPAGEDGNLVHNADGTFTLQDSDGQTYVFGADGAISSVTTATDDRNPAALQYEYQNQDAQNQGTNGAVRLYKIKDGLDPSRNATLYYSGDSNCAAAPSGFDATAPVGMLCAVATNDGRVTNFFYMSGQLARIQLPGGQTTDYGYEQVNNPDGSLAGYRLVTLRSSLANDAIAAGKQANDDTANTHITYDQLGRAITVMQPAAAAGATRVQQTIEYLPGAKSYIDAQGTMVAGYAGATQEHVTGMSEPNGFSRRIKYDSLYRTVEDTDATNLSTTTQWDEQKDLVYSTVAPTGLMSTTVYDDEDRPVSSYGPAPKEWFDTTNPKQQVPLTAYAAQIARSDVTYDGGIHGLAVAYMAANTKAISNTLASGASMAKGQTLWSLDRRFHLSYQGDSNVVLYGPTGAVLWATNTGGAASTNLSMQGDGNLVLYNGGTAIWSTGTGGKGSSVLSVQNDGNAVINNSTTFTWATNTGGQPTGGGTYAVSLTGAPLQHATNIASDGTISKTFGTVAPVSGYSGLWGLQLSGKMRLPQTGAYGFRINSDGGARMWIDDKLVVNDWTDNVAARSRSGTFQETTANTPHRVVIEYFRDGNSSASANFGLYMTAPGGTETAQTAQYFSPDYSLPTSSTTYDSTIGNTTVTANYGANPELGQVQSSTTDPTGLNLTASGTYEQQGAAGSYLRQTSKVLPGSTSANPTITYSYYGPTETRDNPCTPAAEAYKQAGMVKAETDASPDGGATAGVKTESIYDDAGRVVATRANSDDWTCMTYDARGRVSTTVTPAFNGNPARTVSNDYAVGGDPFESATWDGNGTVAVWTDLLGRTVKYRDVHGDETTTSYDQFGNVAQRISPVGTETYDYDAYNRPTDQKLDGTIYATLSYDQFNRVSQVNYPNAGSMNVTPQYDSMLRANGMAYTFGDGTTSLTDTTTLTQSNRVASDTIASGANSLQSSYGYDLAGRLTSATIGTHTYAYGYGAQNASCTGSNMNVSSGKNGNRTSQTIDGVTTNFCYDYADRLVSGSGSQYGSIAYDAHGNMTRLGTATSTSSATTFAYDSSDQNRSMEQYDASGNGSVVSYARDVAGRITARYTSTLSNWSVTPLASLYYGYTSGGSSFIRDAANNIVEKTLQLSGGMTLTIKPQESQANNQKQYSASSALGNTLFTADATGTNTATGSGPLGAFVYDPFGTMVASSNHPNNTAQGSYAYAGPAHKLTETNLTITPIQMGSRVYLPTLGRFTSLDPVVGGTANNYVYSLDPINSSDYNGQSCNAYGCSLSGYMQGGSIGTQQLQNAASAASIQHAAAVSYVQPAASYRRIQSTRTITMSVRITPTIVRATVKPKNNSTAMGVAKVASIALVAADPNMRARMGDVPAPIQSSKRGITTSGFLHAAAGGCVQTAGVIFIVGGIASIVTWGAAAGPTIEATVQGCIDGAIGGAVLYGITDGAERFTDTSSINDAWDYLNEVL